uniref:membrane-spanning 4-domains subfamily A member 4A-like n=1 Tax=Euleptes europaea TaxID=460621 RepID=UPI002541F209|nr:membrane-spanning 4-domains subfamily A member 4A-like [Euleptes europaea]
MDLSSPATLDSISKSIIRPSAPRELKKLYKGEPMALGITQILIGILEFAFGLVRVMAAYSNLYYHYASHFETPYWTGILYIISGSLSVAVAKNPKIPLVKGMLAMNVVSSVAAGIGIIFLSSSVADSIYYYHMCNSYHTSSIPPDICHEYIDIPGHQIHAISAVLLAFTVLEFLIAITTAAFGCGSLCRNSFSETTIVIFQNADQGAPPAVLTPVKEDEAP